MAPARLNAAQRDSQRLRATATNAPAQAAQAAKLNDYRVIFHAHAEDSAHTGGTRPEMLAEAKKAGVHAIFLSDHYRPPRDFITESWRGMHDGVLFVPGSEERGFLLAPTHSIAAQMKLETPEFIKAVTADGGLIFLSHIEERPNHSMEGLDGLEIHNRHFDAKNDKAGILTLVLKMTDPKGIAELQKAVDETPDAIFAGQVEYPKVYLDKWDAETKNKRLTGVAANDCHHNQILIAKMKDENAVIVGTNVDRDDQMRPVPASLRPTIRELVKGHKPGDVVGLVDLDSYHRSFLNSSTHIFASELTENALRDALRNGRAYVSHDWMCDPTGFAFYAQTGDRQSFLGSELKLDSGPIKLVGLLPQDATIRLIADGKPVAQAEGRRFEFDVKEKGVYRLEAWLKIDGEMRGWIYANPIYVR